MGLKFLGCCGFEAAEQEEKIEGCYIILEG